MQCGRSLVVHRLDRVMVLPNLIEVWPNLMCAQLLRLEQDWYPFGPALNHPHALKDLPAHHLTCWTCDRQCHWPDWSHSNVLYPHNSSQMLFVASCWYMQKQCIFATIQFTFVQAHDAQVTQQVWQVLIKINESMIFFGGGPQVSHSTFHYLDHRLDHLDLSSFHLPNHSTQQAKIIVVVVLLYIHTVRLH